MTGHIVSHYRILELIGGGGMGEVYKAEDLRLGRQVAIKFLSPSFVREPKALERFEREARSASALNHPHICTVHDVGEYEGQPFLVMELLEGQTLRQRMRGASIGIDELIDLAIQIADALDAAHSKKIIHRDIKPSNVFITQRGEAKVLDFGLAKRSTTEDAPPPAAGDEITTLGIPVGTVDYMSPEQALGKAVDQRSDLFSLGVVLYEMAAGKRPFSGDSRTAIIDSILHGPPPALTGYSRSIPAELQRIINKLLAKSPDERYQSARDLLVDLRTLKQATASGTPMIQFRTGLLTRRKWAGIWIPAGTLLLFALVWISLPRKAISFQARDWILIGSFENLTGQAVLDDSLDLAFRIALEQSRFANVLPEPEVKKALLRMKRDEQSKIDRTLGVEICQREGITALIAGGILKIGKTYSLSAEIVDPQTARSVFTETATAYSQDEILTELGKLARAVREHLGESLSAIEQTTRPLEKVTASNLEALKIYSLGKEKFNQARYEDAIPLFQRAVELDPEFAMAHAGLGAAYSNAGWGEEKSMEHRRLALRFADRLTDFERLYVQGSNAWSGSPNEMVRIWSLMSSLYPDAPAGHHNLGMAYLVHYNNFQRAAEAFIRATQTRNPLEFIAYYYLGYCQLGLGQVEAATKSFEHAWKTESESLLPDLANSFMALKRYPEAQDFLRKSAGLSNPRRQIESMALLATWHVDQGSFREALSVYQEALNRAHTRGLKRLEGRILSGTIACLDQYSKTSTLRSTLSRAIEAEKRHLSENKGHSSPVPLSHLVLLAKVWARNFDGQKPEEILSAIRPAAEQAEDFLGKASIKMLEGEIALARGSRSEAVALFKDALSHVDLLQIHESLAHAYEMDGRIEMAIEEYSWISKNRGRAFVEHWNHLASWDFNVVDWAESHFHLGRLYDLKGEKPKAQAYYQAFLRHWKSADKDLPLVQQATRRVTGKSKTKF